MSNPLFYRLALTMVPQVGPVTTKNLIETLGSAKNAFDASKKELHQVIGEQSIIIDNIQNKETFKDAETEVKFIEQNKVEVLFYQDDNFPERVRVQPAAPALLFYKGNAKMNHHRTIGIVGTRKTTPYGQEICKNIVQEMRKYDVHIISGLANGIDSVAHRSSVEHKVPTIGVLGHGLQMLYPYNNERLAGEMIENGGLLTEYTSNQGPDREHFPARNKIVAAMCDALLVVESASRGGSLITARFAKDYFKKVFAIPGRTNDTMSEGCNSLIKNKLADLVENGDDIAQAMGWKAQSNIANIQTQLFIELDDQEKEIISVIKKLDTPSLDRLCYETKIMNSEMASLLLNLEFKGVIKSLPGKRYIQTA